MTAQRFGHFSVLFSRSVATAAAFLCLCLHHVSAAPTNDNFAARAPLASDVTVAQGDNIGATFEPGEPVHSPDPSATAGGRSVWWRWTPTSSGSVTITTVGSHLPDSALPLQTQLAVYTGTLVSALNGTDVAKDDHSAGNGWSSVTFNAQAAVQYKIAVDGVGGAQGIIQLNFSQEAVTNQPPTGRRPVVAISSPAAGTRVTNATLTVRGTARPSGTNPVANVVFQLNEAAFQTASGTSNWTADVQLNPGTNTFLVKSVNTVGVESLPAVRQFIFTFLSPLTVQTNGSGRVSPNTLSGTLREVGKVIHLAAFPAAGNLFAGWSGSTQSNSPALDFVMVPNAVLTANFVTNPFTPLRGTYNGLVSGNPEVDTTNSGCIRISVGGLGAFSGRASVGGKSWPLSGVFNPVTGQALVTSSQDSNTVSGNLALDLGNGSEQITGNLSGTNWTATVLADHSVFHARTNLAPYAGLYTFIFARNDTVNGYGFGRIRVTGGGNVYMTGRLADGTAMAAATTVSKNGLWPLCRRLYGNRGLLLGWMRFNNEDFSSLQGNPINWIRPAIARSPLYPDGFNLDLVAVGSLFISPPGRTPLLAWRNGVLELGGGNLESNIVNLVTVGSNNVVSVNSNSNRVSLRLSPSGLLSGSFVHPANSQLRSLQGVVLMKTNWAAGFFRGADRSGYVTLTEDLSQNSNVSTTPDSPNGYTLTLSPARQTGELRSLNLTRLTFSGDTATGDVDSFGTPTFNYASDSSTAHIPRVAELNLLHGRILRHEVVIRMLLTYTSSTAGTYLAQITAGGAGSASGTFTIAPTVP